jgi:hypothetical protein
MINLDAFTNRDEYRFWKYVDSEGDEGCWNWKGGKTSKGYGRFHLHGRSRYAHRVSWVIFNNRQIPENMEICHACDNPACVNPGHLWLGTHSENIQDSFDKGRVPAAPRGEQTGNNVLTNEHVKEIKASVKLREFKRGEKTPFYQFLADKYRVSFRTIENIVYGVTWSHV